MDQVRVSVITIGDELLIGQVIDTNSAWIGQALNKIGVWVHRRLAVGDEWNEIWKALDDESAVSNVILITGGLGPTADDITKPLLCEYFSGKMITDEATLEHITYLFTEVFKRPLPLLESNSRQALVPDVATVLKNEVGTAPNMLFEKDGKIFISMPGVPHEMKAAMNNHVLPLLQQRFQLPYIGHRTLLTAGIGESFLAERIKGFESSLPSNIKLAYLPNYGMVRLRLTAQGDKEKTERELNERFAILKEEVKDVLAVDEDIPFEILVGKLLRQHNKTVSTAESCTGGYIAHLITSIAGSSDYFKGSVVSYSNSIKENVLQVNNETLSTVGAVSEETVKEMISGVLKVMQTDYAMAVSGIMGPGGGSEDKPVGTVWIAVGNTEKIETKRMHFRFDRKRNIELTAVNALYLLYRFVKTNS
ncbi:CinA family nicotinamide mononucleotide deamidase-related protein [Parafilimonas sp.]|uniref:CinA family nicotinamide mononucleotide deamidase-related protein n=1 Tax=Parafilimonas sp. TaxID=1969739 RepID=UPI003F7E7A14